MLVLGQELYEPVEQNFVKTFLKNFAACVKQRYGPVVLQAFIAFLEDWRYSRNLQFLVSFKRRFMFLKLMCRMALIFF